MSYKNKTIIETIKLINAEYYLPSIQRKFVWESKQIENLFDSIMSNYPIGTFLFWKIEKGEDPSRIDDYTFYNFINNYSEKDCPEMNQSRLDKPSLKEHISAVLDGQQRLSSLYCALKGTYAFKTSKKLSPDNPYPQRELYLNLVYRKTNEMSNQFEFKFLLGNEATIIDARHYWLKVKDVLTWADNKDKKAQVKKQIKNLIENIKSCNLIQLSDDEYSQIEIQVETLWDKLVCEELITYYEINKESLNEILDIFVRVNSAGTFLSKSDLVFSTIVANWENGREKIENLIDILNEKGDGFAFDKDFIITLCLALLDYKIKFEVTTFTRSVVAKAEQEWGNIVRAICDSVDLLVEFGFSKETLTATYIIIPVAYFLFKSKIKLSCLNQRNRDSIHRYIVCGLVKKVFSGGVDTVLTSMLNALRKPNDNNTEYILKNKKQFDFESIRHLTFQERTFAIDMNDLEDILNMKKSAHSFMVLSLLYPNINYKNEKWHQDHIHPRSSFDKKRLEEYFLQLGKEISADKCREWKEKSDTICNIQLLTGTKNLEKSKISLSRWIDAEFHSSDEREVYCKTNYIDQSAGLELQNFDVYYEKRRELLKSALISVLNVTREEDNVSDENNLIPLEDRYTIVEAAKVVLVDHPEGLSVNQIYDEIVRRNLYVFNAQNPQNILRIEIRRACDCVRISNERLIKIFKIVKDVNGVIYYANIN